MHDALSFIAQRVQRDTEVPGVGLERRDLFPRDGIGDMLPVVGRHIVVHRGEGQAGTAYGPSGQAKALEGLGTGDLVNQMAIDVEQNRPVRPRRDHVAPPDFLQQRFLHDGSQHNVGVPRAQVPPPKCRRLETALQSREHWS